jgi:hypothetical protein
MYSVFTSRHFSALKKEAGKHAKIVSFSEIHMNLKNLFAAHETIFNFSKQFLTQIKQRIRIESIS